MNDIEKMVVEKQPFKNLVIVRATFDKALFFVDNTAISRPVIELELECEGRKKPIKRSMTYSFCPFCGSAYDALPETKKEVLP